MRPAGGVLIEKAEEEGLIAERGSDRLDARSTRV